MVHTLTDQQQDKGTVIALGTLSQEVYTLSKHITGDGEEDTHDNVMLFSCINTAYVAAFECIAFWTEGDFDPYDSDTVLKFRRAIEQQRFAEALEIWNDEMTGSCFLSIDRCQINMLDMLTPLDVADNALLELFGEEELATDD